MRWYLGNGVYRREVIGVADDLIAEGNFSFEQAIKKGRDFVAGIRAAGLREKPRTRHTVRSAITAYVEMRDDRIRTQVPGSRRRSDAASRLKRFVLDHKIAGTYLDKLTEEILGSWMRGLANKAKATTNARTIND
ncbi:MAG TPA: hypothetical protein VFT56_07270 [Sphingomonas sp.]|nr:hypothetical protein [Sphingomonas sp.]